MTQAPHRVPPVFAGGRVIVYGLLPGQPRAARVTLRGQGPAGPLEVALDIDPAAARRERVVVTLAARALIRDLEEGTSALHDRRGSLQERGREDRVKAEIVRLGTTYGLASRETSFVAVEERATPLHGEAQLRRVTVALTRGWGGVGDTPLGAGVPVRPGAPPMPPMAAAAAFIPPRPPKLALPRPLIADLPPDFALEEELDACAAPVPSYVSEGAPAAVGSRPLDRLVALQRADGSWDLTADLVEVLGPTLHALEAELHGAQGDPALARRAWATALALSWLERHAADCRDEWRLLARKAERWLRGCAAVPASGDWTSAAARWKL